MRAVHTILHTWTTACRNEGVDQGHGHTLEQSHEATLCYTLGRVRAAGSPESNESGPTPRQGKRSRSKDKSFPGVLILGSFPMPPSGNLYKRAAHQCCETPPKPMAPAPSLKGPTNRSVTMALSLVHVNARATPTARRERDTQHEMPHSIRRTPIMT